MESRASRQSALSSLSNTENNVQLMHKNYRKNVQKKGGCVCRTGVVQRFVSEETETS